MRFVTATLTRAQQGGVAVLLVYGLEIPLPRDGRPGFRLTVQVDGAVWVQPVGFPQPPMAETLAIRQLTHICTLLGLDVEPLPIPGTPPGIVVRRPPRRF